MKDLRALHVTTRQKEIKANEVVKFDLMILRDHEEITEDDETYTFVIFETEGKFHREVLRDVILPSTTFCVSAEALITFPKHGEYSLRVDALSGIDIICHCQLKITVLE